MRQMKFVKSWILRLLDGSEVVIIDLPQKGMADNAAGLEKSEEIEGGNEIGEDGFRELSATRTNGTSVPLAR